LLKPVETGCNLQFAESRGFNPRWYGNWPTDFGEVAKIDGSAIGPRGGTGCIELKHITDRKSSKTFGPYRYLRYRSISQKTGKAALLSVYLGKVGAIGS
jgi:hypothetical protein